MNKHNSFKKDYKILAKKYRSIDRDFETSEMLLKKYFSDDPNSKNIIDPGKIHRLHSFENYEIWKLEMKVRGIDRPNQWPRFWFMIIFPNKELVALCINIHTANYNDNMLTKIAQERAIEYFS